ncbi:Squalene epoxidase [Mortierella claussenii]|nr:Squalene epoxidase [Mortierella claussenii]
MTAINDDVILAVLARCDILTVVKCQEVSKRFKRIIDKDLALENADFSILTFRQRRNITDSVMTPVFAQVFRRASIVDLDGTGISHYGAMKLVTDYTKELHIERCPRVDLGKLIQAIAGDRWLSYDLDPVRLYTKNREQRGNYDLETIHKPLYEYTWAVVMMSNDCPWKALTLPLATVPVPKHGSAFDIIVVGAGVLGSAFATTFAKQNKRVLLLERDLSEPDRIVGELLQPGGYKALKELGLEECLEGIDAIPTYGYGVIRGSEHVHIPYLTNAETGKQDQGRSFHHGRFIQKLRAAASQTPNVTIVEATVNEMIHDEDGVRVIGITCSLKKSISAESTEGASTVTAQYFAPLTVIADGCFSKFRKQFIQKPVATTSHFIGFVMKDVQLPFPNHGHVILASPSPILMYQISTTDTRILVDVPGKLPSASSGALHSYLENTVRPQLPESIQKHFMKALETERLRSMPNSFLPPSTSSELGVILLGDAMNMRHPLTGGGMTVALNDVVYLRDMLNGDVTKDQEETMVQMELFFWKRKELSGVINVLAQALYALFSGADENLLVLRDGCFSYFTMGGECIAGPVGLLSGITRRRMVLVYHFYAVALHSIWLMFHKASWAEVPSTFFKAFSVMWTACVVLLPVMWSECKA